MIIYKALVDYMHRNGFIYEDGKFKNDYCHVSIVDDSYYHVHLIADNSDLYSKDLIMYWLIGVLKHHNLIEDLKTPIHFGRWLLKYCKEKLNNGFLVWQYDLEEYNTEELFELFKKL